MLLIGAAAYYLSDVPGNAQVLAKRVELLPLPFQGGGLSSLLLWIFKKELYKEAFDFAAQKYADSLNIIAHGLRDYFTSGNGEHTIYDELNSLRRQIYNFGEDREVLLVDLACAVVRKRIATSTRKSLAEYSDLEESLWEETIAKPSFVREFWPSQIKIGKKDVYNGKSAIIQMPTSAGKTKATEIIIRSSFLSKRSDLAVVVAPFRALCNEIKLDLSRAFNGEAIHVDIPPDSFQFDFAEVLSFNYLEKKLVLILTPEKLLYMLRHAPELGPRIGLLIYDEGHQFDNGLRGVTYELLLASLKDVVPEKVQVILISAVISNASLIGDWLIGKDKEIVSTTGLLSTYRTIAFASWTDPLGRLEFVKQEDPTQRDYFVPRVLEETPLTKRKPKEGQRFFPVRDNSNSIALYLAMALSKNGAAAIFCGSKPSIGTICEMAIETYNRAYTRVLPPATHSDANEIERLKYLHQLHYGAEHDYTRCCELGLFTHSGSTPEGIRHSVEYAIKEGKIKVVVCTSTLAQGVNLPIRYLLITSTNQSGSEIKTRDFHNLIGRAGRSGMHTEGSIIFTNPNIYDQRLSRFNRWRWDNAVELLNPENSEPCASTLLSIFEPVIAVREEVTFKPNRLVDAYIGGSASINAFKAKILSKFSSPDAAQSEVDRQLNDKIQILCAIESYLMSHSDILEVKGEVERLAKGTLAYFLADQNEDDRLKEGIVSLFEKISAHVIEMISDPAKRKRFGKTLLGVQDLLDIENWADENIDLFSSIQDEDTMLHFIWPILTDKIKSSIFNKLTPTDLLYEMALHWIYGMPYSELLRFLSENDVKVRAKSQLRKVTQDQVNDVCDGGLGFDATLIIAALYEVYSFRNEDEYEDQLMVLNSLQKRIKYGLENSREVLLYEIGFSDRALVQELAEVTDEPFVSKLELGKFLTENPSVFDEVLAKYPSYFEHVLKIILAEYK
jgi:hypothetical protein